MKQAEQPTFFTTRARPDGESGCPAIACWRGKPAAFFTHATIAWGSVVLPFQVSYPACFTIGTSGLLIYFSRP